VKKTLILAPGVEFRPEPHEYWYRGQQLSGITSRIGKRLGLRYNDWVEEHRVEGVHVHEEIARWLNREETGSIHPGVRWVMDTLKDSFTGTVERVYPEVLVSDFERYASPVDIVGLCTDGLLEIYDLKKGRLNREYVSWQLGIYKYLIETYSPYRVRTCTAVSLADAAYYPVIPRDAGAVAEFLYGKEPA
jgi:hypothetical protein